MTSSSSWSRHHQYGEPQNKKHKQKRSTGIPLSIDSWTNSSVSHPHLILIRNTIPEILSCPITSAAEPVRAEVF